MKKPAQIARYLSNQIDLYAGPPDSDPDDNCVEVALTLLAAFRFIFGPHDGRNERLATIARLEAEESFQKDVL